MDDNENRETWQARLWLSNDVGMYVGARELIETDGSGNEYSETSELRNYVEETVIDGPTSGLLADIIGLWLGRVDWYAVRESLLDETPIE